MTTSNATLLEIVDFVSMKINGIPAQSLGARPSKEEIIAEVNEVQDQIVNALDWRFAKKVTSVKGYTVDSTAATIQNWEFSYLLERGLHMTAPGTYVFAQKFNLGNTPINVNKLTFSFYNDITNGLPTGTMKVDIYQKDSAPLIIPPYNPDMTMKLTNGQNKLFVADTPKITSDSVDISTIAGQLGYLDVTFPADSFLKEGLPYWMVITITAAADFGADLQFFHLGRDYYAYPAYNVNAKIGCFDGTPDYNATYSNSLIWTGPTTYRPDTGGTFIAGDGTDIKFTIDCNTCTYVNILDLPADVEKIHRIFPVNMNPGQISGNLLPYGDDKYVNNPQMLPLDRFVQRDYNADGTIQVLIKPSLAATVEEWSVEYKSKGATLVNDSDISIIPSSYRGLLKYKTVLNFLGQGFGQQDQNATIAMATDINNLLKSMRREYLAHPPKGFRLNRGGGVSMFPIIQDVPNRTWISTGVPIPLRTLASEI